MEKRNTNQKKHASAQEKKKPGKRQVRVGGGSRKKSGTPPGRTMASGGKKGSCPAPMGKKKWTTCLAKKNNVRQKISKANASK